MATVPMQNPRVRKKQREAALTCVCRSLWRVRRRRGSRAWLSGLQPSNLPSEWSSSRRR